MARSRVTVVFACPYCSAAFSAIQRPGPDVGSFDCWDCTTEVYSWSGNYKYVDWDQIEFISVKEKARRKTTRGSARPSRRGR